METCHDYQQKCRYPHEPITERNWCDIPGVRRHYTDYNGTPYCYDLQTINRWIQQSLNRHNIVLDPYDESKELPYEIVRDIINKNIMADLELSNEMYQYLMSKLNYSRDEVIHMINTYKEQLRFEHLEYMEAARRLRGHIQNRRRRRGAPPRQLAPPLRIPPARGQVRHPSSK